MVEYLRVTFDASDSRRVIANGNDVGPTETLLMLEPAEYNIRLSGSDFSPLAQAVILNGTTPSRPRIIRFVRPGAAVAAPAPVPAQTPALAPAFGAAPAPASAPVPASTPAAPLAERPTSGGAGDA